MRLRLRDDAPGLLAIERGAPGRWRRRIQAVAWVNVIIGFIFVPSAVANPFCYIPMVCEAKAAIDFVNDPLGFLLQKLTEANIWFLRKMLDLIQNTTQIDLTSSGFLKQYAIIFAASSLLTVALWLIAVAKRAVRGVALTTAVSEAVGFLLLQVVVNAMTPGAIALLMKAIDDVTAIFEPYATSNFKPFLDNILKVMAANPTEGVGQLLVVNLIMLCGALLMWIELLIRSAAIYVAVALGPIVNAGLVDKDLWGKSKKWFGAIFAIGLSKPVLFALLGLGGSILSDSSGAMTDAVSKTLVGALILLLAVFASGTLYRWVPAFGDEMAQLHNDRKSAQSSGPASAVDGPGQHANRAISSHVQDSLVGGSAKTAASKVGGGTAATGPIGTAVALTKAGVDVAKNKATNSPGVQGADTGKESDQNQAPQQNDGDQGESSVTPATTRPEGTTSDPVVSSPPDWASASNHAAAGSLPGTNGAPGKTQPPSTQAPVSPAPSPPTAPSSPSSTSGTTSGSGPSITPTPPSLPSGGQAPGRPNPSKDQ
ncbi:MULTISPECIES: hypothetical protein [unclassified Streptomyces]|uniref:hypothetical protein n=1 Tax=unclassified Streptomyces TaxID=2593676 RepID=UPI00224DBB1A|nr:MULTISPECIES: hypothetical protein [unclassified Streptomyces]MCX4549627.1 hypothetical protein [Streptomyces sp. NBC_01500]WSC21157.1 hypothetical protein OIE60_16515 [Streptomyces sp. NBC_01766]